MNQKILRYFYQNRPLFLALIRSVEIPFYQKYTKFQGKVLDFGCGDGFFLHVLNKYCRKIFDKPKIIGVDLNEKPLKEAKGWQIYKSLQIIDGQKTPYNDNYFDSILSNCVFEHIKDLKPVLKELNRVLKTGNELYCTVMTKQWDKYVALPSKWWRTKQKHYSLLSIEGWYKKFNKAGFSVKVCEPYLSKKQSRLIERLHFFSLPYLISYKLFNDWSVFGKYFKKIVPEKKYCKLFSRPVNRSEAAAAFFVLQK